MSRDRHAPQQPNPRTVTQLDDATVEAARHHRAQRETQGGTFLDDLKHHQERLDAQLKRTCPLGYTRADVDALWVRHEATFPRANLDPYSRGYADDVAAALYTLRENASRNVSDDQQTQTLKPSFPGIRRLDQGTDLLPDLPRERPEPLRAGDIAQHAVRPRFMLPEDWYLERAQQLQQPARASVDREVARLKDEPQVRTLEQAHGALSAAARELEAARATASATEPLRVRVHALALIHDSLRQANLGHSTPSTSQNDERTLQLDVGRERPDVPRLDDRVVAQYTNQLLCENIAPYRLEEIANIADRLSTVVPRDERSICDAWHIWRCTEWVPDSPSLHVQDRNLAFAQLYIDAAFDQHGFDVEDRDNSNSAARHPDVADVVHPERAACADDLREIGMTEYSLRADAGMLELPRHLCDKALMALGRGDDLDLKPDVLANAGRDFRHFDPDVSDRVSHRVIVPFVTSRLLESEPSNYEIRHRDLQLAPPGASNTDFWAAHVVSDSLLYRETSPESRHDDYRTAVDAATAALAIDYWEIHERCADSKNDERVDALAYSATFQVCRLVCADLVDDEKARRQANDMSLFDVVRYGGFDKAKKAQLEKFTARVRHRLEDFAFFPERYMDRIPSLS